MAGVINTSIQEFRRFCEQGEFDEATSLLQTKEISDAHTGWGDRRLTPLHWACRHGNLDFVKLLIEKFEGDPEVTLFGHHEETPLHIAAVEGHLDIVKYLTTEAKCNPNFYTRHYRRPPITYACGFADFPPHYSDDKQAREVVKYLYNSCNCNPNWRDAFGMTPLHNACANRRFILVQYLVSECQCNVALRDRHGNTLIHLVCQEFPLPIRENSVQEALEIIRFLVIQYHCDPNATNMYGDTPLNIASDPQIIAELVGCGPQGRKAGMYRKPNSFLGRSNPC